MKTKNGWVDDGRRVGKERCPNCGSRNFIETLSQEKCDDCGLECDYWGGGVNAVYEAMVDKPEFHANCSTVFGEQYQVCTRLSLTR